MQFDPVVIYAIVGAVLGVLVPIYGPKLLKKAPKEVLEDISEVGKAAEQVVGKGDNNV